MILAPTNRRIIRPYDKPSFEHTQRYGLIKGHPLGPAGGNILTLFHNEGSGLRVTDLSGYNNHGTLAGTAPSWNGKWGTAIWLPGDDERIEIADSPELDGFSAFTILSNIILFDAGGVTGSTIAYKWTDFGGSKLSWAFRATETRYLRGGFNDSGDTTHFLSDDTTQLNLNQHYDVGLVYDGQYLRLFLDGVQVKSSSIGSFTVKSTTADIHMGAQHNVGGEWFNAIHGIIDHFVIYNRGLLASEINQLIREPYCTAQKKTAPVYFFAPPGEIKELTGTITGQSVVTGSIKVTRKIAGTTAGQSAVSGAIDVSRKIAGTVGVQSVVTGSIKVVKELVGTITIQSGVSGSLTGIWTIAGTITCQSTVSGNLFAPAGGLSSSAENKLLDHLTGKAPFAKPTVYIGFCIADPGEEATGADCSEVANTFGYARIATTAADWNSASGGAIANANALTSPCATGGWGTITHYVLVDSPTYGEGAVLVYDRLDDSVVIEEDDLIQFGAGELSLTLD